MFKDLTIVDTNALIILIVGLIDPNLIPKVKRTSIYDKDTFEDIKSLIGDFSKLLVIPNIMTEADNLLNGFLTGSRKYDYITAFEAITKTAREEYLKSFDGVSHYSFQTVGLADSLVLQAAVKCKALVTADSKVGDFAKSLGVDVFDMVEYQNIQIRTRKR